MINLQLYIEIMRVGAGEGRREESSEFSQADLCWRDSGNPLGLLERPAIGLLHASRSEGHRTLRVMPLAEMDVMNSLAFFPKAGLGNRWKT